jgi:hypothetical protein
MTVKNLASAKTPAGYRMVNRSADKGEIYLYGPVGV